jgi:lysophospholipase L1-like esterase
LAGVVNVVSVATSGITTQQLTSEAPTKVDPLYRPDALSIVIMWEGTNDIGQYNLNGQTAYGHVQAYCAARAARGWLVIGVPIIPRGNFTAAMRTASIDFNSRLLLPFPFGRFGKTPPPDGCTPTPLSGHPVFDDPYGDYLDPAYYNGDKVHLTDAGYGVVANVVGQTVRDVLSIYA